jgi:N-hydroxyarylamine O-acetyltransferase
MTPDVVARYLGRIGLPPEPPEPTLETLRTLQLAHLRTVPFENLSIHLGEPVGLDEEVLTRKIVDRRRGGFCYELNGAFAVLLRALGYDVDLLQAKVFGDDGPGIPFDHLALRVRLDEPWLVDVGFGRSHHFPVGLDRREEQADPDGVYAVRPAPHGDLDLLRDGAPQLRIDPRPRELSEFVPTCWWHTTSPASHFTQGDVCSLLLPDGGRVTLKGSTLTRTDGEGTRTTTDVRDPLATYRELFDLRLDRLPSPPGR